LPHKRERRQTAVKTNEKPKYEKRFHVVKRAEISLERSLLVRIAAVAAALIFCALLSMALIGANPLKFISTLFDGAFGSPRRLWKFAKDTAVLLCISLAVTPAFRMRFWNIGAEGQVLVGALASVACAFYLGNSVPNWLLLVIMFFASLLAGALWAFIPAVFKAKWGTNETLFTLMMNYVATYLVAYFLLVWTPDGSSTLGELKVGHMPKLYNEYLLLIIIVVVLTALMYVYLNFTKQGYEISVVGESENTARYIGINVGKVILRTMLVSGAVCGIAGFLIVGALDHSITTTTVGGLGFTAIMASWLAKFNPFIMIVTSGLIVALTQGGAQISTNFNISSAFPDMVVGIILFFIIGCEFFINYRIKTASPKKKEVQKV